MFGSAFSRRTDCELGHYWVCRTCGRCYLTEPEDLSRSCHLCRFEPRKLTLAEALVAVFLGLVVLLVVVAVLKAAGTADAQHPASGRPLIEDPR